LLLLQGPAAAAAGGGGNVFDAKTEKGSAELYFHYYGMLMHQQNMLQVRLLQRQHLLTGLKHVAPACHKHVMAAGPLV
jgi:histone-arginine methyltransferase CARM1